MPRVRRQGRAREMGAIAVLGAALGMFWLLALVTYRPDGTGAGSLLPLSVLPVDVCGAAGRRLAAFATAVLGQGSALAVPAFLIVLSARLFVGARALVGRVLALIVAWGLLVPPVLGLLRDRPAPGGAYGALVSGALRSTVGGVGAWILLAAGAVAAVLLFTDWRIRLPDPLRRVRVPVPDLSGVGDRGRAVSRAAGAVLVRLLRALALRAVPEPAEPRDLESEGTRRAPTVVGGEGARSGEGDSGDGAYAGPVPGLDPEPPGILEPEEALPAAESAGKRVRRVRRDPEVRKLPGERYAVPPLSILSEPPPTINAPSREQLLDRSETLRRTLEEFGIRGRVGEVHPGPVITRYDFEPAPGIKVNQVLSREDDIALALRTDRVRILPRIPGKAAVGIEIPNDEPDLIHFREVISSRAFRESRGELALALGKDTSGRPFTDRLETMPHLLVAGTTGSGKSVCINTIISSLLFRHRPEDLRLILIDPKMLELTGYNGIPHLALPVVTEAKEAAKALNWLIREMERRYRVLAGRSVRNIQTYQQKFFPGGAPQPVADDEEPPEPMPYIVCIVDELADLMMTYASEIETPIARLAQMARAVGIHLVLATQRPSVDVITGVIKANFPARVAFQVASRTDSRTILDQNGAESLIGRGDMLYLPPGRPAPVRLHGAFLSDQDIEALVAHLRRFASTLAPIELDEPSDGGVIGGEGEDPLFKEAARLVILQGQASTSFLQRRLKVGYARAGRLMDELERAGIVGGFEGSKAREVLVDLQYLEEQGIL